MTDVLIKGRNLDTDINKWIIPLNMKIEIKMMVYKPMDTKDANETPEAKGAI